MAEIVELYAGFASAIKVHFAALNDLDSVPTGPGWYAWFHVPNSPDEAAFQLYRHSKVDSTVTGIFNLTFEGRLRATGAKPSAVFDAAAGEKCFDTLRSLFLAFAPPLYIGISKRLRRRLKSHRKKLQEFVASADAQANELAEKAGIEGDSERESQFFGARIGAALRTLKISPDTLYVKCVVAENASELRMLETVLNFALTPHYGRK